MLRNLEELQAEAESLVAKARTYGFDLTIRHEPLPPLSMGNHVTVLSLAPSNEMYRKASLLPGAIEQVI